MNDTTHQFSTPFTRDLFNLGASCMLASKAAAQGHKEAAERAERLLEDMSMIAEPPPDEPMTDEELAEMARYYEARAGRVNPHD